MEIVLPDLRLLKHEKECETKTVTRTLLSGISSPNFHNRLHLGHYSWKWQKKTSSFGKLLHENGRNVLFKNMRQLLDIAMVTKGGGGG